MTLSVDAPDGTRWTVRRVRMPWRLRHRATFEPDPVGVLLWLLAGVLLCLEAIALSIAWAVQLVRHALGVPWIVEAMTPGPPRRLLRWEVVGRAARDRQLQEVAHDLMRGRDVTATATTRTVGP
jgi:hypothetical protein